MRAAALSAPSRSRRAPAALWLAFLAAFLLAAPAAAQTFPDLTGRVVDQAGLLPPEEAAALSQRLAALEQETSRQLVIATIADLDGMDIADYGTRLGRHWGIGREGIDNGVLLIVAPAERRVRIEVGYGLEPIVTDALAGRIIRNVIRPAFRDGDYPGGIRAGADALIEQLQAPPEQAEQRALEAAEAERRRGGGSVWPLVFWLVVAGIIAVVMIGGAVSAADGGGRRGRRYRRGRLPVVVWGPGVGGGGGRSSGWGGGGFGGGGFGGFGGGGGSFGGGGASGGW